MKKVIPLIAILVFAWLIVNNPLSNTYVSTLINNSILVTAGSDRLYEAIRDYAEKNNVDPINAKIDPVWKAIPGINGLTVDVEASFKKMKNSEEFTESKIVFEQVSPETHLEDLPPSAIYKGNPDKQMISFLINVAWGNEYLPDMLAILEKYHVKASFFLEGRWVKKNPELAKMIVEAGHEVGNHSYTHPDMNTISASQIEEEIVKTNEVIKATTGKTVTWLAPPSGSYNNEVVKIAAKYNLGTLMWSIDTIDWQKPTPEVLQQRVMSKIHNGAMILMHPTEATMKSLEQLIIQIQAKNLEIGSVTDMLSEKRVITNKIPNSNE